MQNKESDLHLLQCTTYTKLVKGRFKAIPSSLQSLCTEKGVLTHIEMAAPDI